MDCLPNLAGGLFIICVEKRGNVTRKLVLSFLALLLVGLLGGGCSNNSAAATVKIAVEFNNHAAAAYIAHDKGWFEEIGLEMLPVFQAYESGASIAAALARGDIQVAYMGLTGAILSYAAGVPIKVISGVHKYGYGLVARPEIEDIADLEGKTIGVLREGTVTDQLFRLMVDRYQLTDVAIRRMSPAQEVLALVTGSLDAAFIPEQHATVAEANGFHMLIKSQDLWPGMQGDVLVVTTELIQDEPELVKMLMEVTQRANDWIGEFPLETAEIMAAQLRIVEGQLALPGQTPVSAGMEITPEIITRSMTRVTYSTGIDPEVVQDTIDFMVSLGYIQEGVTAADILDLGFLEDETANIPESG